MRILANGNVAFGSHGNPTTKISLWTPFSVPSLNGYLSSSFAGDDAPYNTFSFGISFINNLQTWYNNTPGSVGVSWGASAPKDAARIWYTPKRYDEIPAFHTNGIGEHINGTSIRYNGTYGGYHGVLSFGCGFEDVNNGTSKEPSMTIDSAGIVSFWGKTGMARPRVRICYGTPKNSFSGSWSPGVISAEISDYTYTTFSNPLYLNPHSNTYTWNAQHVILCEHGGFVGVRTFPSFPLTVSGPVTHPFGNYYKILGENTSVYNPSSYTTSISIASLDGGLWTTRVVASSDARIKENVEEVPDGLSLISLRNIKCCYYNYKDKVIRSPDKTIGFIAQQVKEHMPIAVSTEKNYIPNELRILENPQWSLSLDSSGNNVYKLTIPDLEIVPANTKYKFIVSDLSSNFSEKFFKTLEKHPQSFIFDEKYEQIIIYGKEVNDFHVLDKQKLFTLNFSATQEIDRIQQLEKKKVKTLEATVEEQNKTIQELHSQITDLMNVLREKNII